MRQPFYFGFLNMISSCGTWTDSFKVHQLPFKFSICHWRGFLGALPLSLFSLRLSNSFLLYTHSFSPLPLFSLPQYPQVKIHFESWFLPWNEMDQSWAIDFYEVQLNPFCVRFELLHLVHTDRSVFWGDYPTLLSSPGFHGISIVPLFFFPLLKRKL